MMSAMSAELALRADVLTTGVDTVHRGVRRLRAGRSGRSAGARRDGVRADSIRASEVHAP